MRSRTARPLRSRLSITLHALEEFPELVPHYLALSRDKPGHITAVAPIPTRGNADFNLLSGLDHPVAITRAVDIVPAVSLKLNVACAFGVGDLKHDSPVRVGDLPGFDDAFDLDAFTEILGCRGVMGARPGHPQADQDHSCHNSRCLHDFRSTAFGYFDAPAPFLSSSKRRAQAGSLHS